MTAARPLRIVVVGAGMTGLTTAILLARDGHQVTVLDRDPAPPPSTAEGAWSDWDRRGVSQFRQPHLMLPRWRHEIGRELPDLIDHLVADGAGRVNLLHLQPESVTHGWQPGDDEFDTVTARRPVLEASLGRFAASEPGLTVRRGARVRGLLTTRGDRVPHVRGVTTADGELAADLVVDAAGRHTPVPGLVRSLGGGEPAEVRETSGFVYYGRHYRSVDSRLPDGRGPVLTHLPSMSVLTLPADHGTYCVVLLTSSRDRQLHALRDEAAWLAAVARTPAAAHWVTHGRPITDVAPFAGLADVRRSYLRDGEPVVTGLVAVGDSAAATNPALGRGTAIGVLHACALRDVLSTCWRDPREQAVAFGAATAEQVTPWVEASLRFSRHRLAEMEADTDGVPYDTGDPTWPMTTALLAGGRHDPVLARASSRIAGLLATPLEVFRDPHVQTRMQPYVGAPRYPPTDPTRDELVRAIRASSPATAPRPIHQQLHHTPTTSKGRIS